MTLPIRIALQNSLWNRFKITFPDLEKLLNAYLAYSGQKIPDQVERVDSFITNGFAAYLEPIPGFICSKKYPKTTLEQAGIILVKKGEGSHGWHNSYQDENFGTWWVDVEGRYGELIGAEFQLLGKEKIKGLQGY
ncbi:MAG: hypothetical protein ACXWQ7_14020 [Bdellovibrio sp.]